MIGQGKGQGKGAGLIKVGTDVNSTPQGFPQGLYDRPPQPRPTPSRLGDYSQP